MKQNLSALRKYGLLIFILYVVIIGVPFLLLYPLMKLHEKFKTYVETQREIWEQAHPDGWDQLPEHERSEKI